MQSKLISALVLGALLNAVTVHAGSPDDKANTMVFDGSRLALSADVLQQRDNRDNGDDDIYVPDTIIWDLDGGD